VWLARRGWLRAAEEQRQEKSVIPKKVFVGNLSFDVTREELIETFGGAGRVVDAKLPADRETGRPRGFAFVEFEDEAAVERCIAQLNGQTLKGRPLRVSAAEDRPPRPPGSGPGPRPGGFAPRPSFRPGPPGAGFRGTAPPPPFEEESRGRRRQFSGKPSGRPYSKEKAPRRVEKRRRQNDFDDEDY
jgi:RNA recognition motif-containing protein